MEPEIQSAPSLNIFKKNILKLIRPTADKIFICKHLKNIKYLRLGLVFSHLHERKFKNSFQHTLNMLWSCDYNVENICYFLLLCPNLLTERNTLLNKITN